LVLEFLQTGKRKPLCSFKSGKSVLIEPDGNTYLCGNFKEFFIGNILRDAFRVMSRNAEGINRNMWRRCCECGSNCYIEEVLN
jgi:radical SAM protein with 4Fe4S-binding SPASM domain